MAATTGRAGVATGLNVATRGSPLARWQAGWVAERIGAVPSAPRCELVVVHTTGDALAEVPVSHLGGQGAFVKEVQFAVLDGRADIAVHSAKDLPPVTPDGLELACVPHRADPRDALVGRRFDDLPTGAMVATGSARRRAQLAWARPDLTFCDLRGNMATRIEKSRAVGAGVVALAALERLDLAGSIADVLDVTVMLPQVGQGALAVECRVDDAATADLLRAIDDRDAHQAVLAERAFLAALGGGCTLPVGAWARPGVGQQLTMDVLMASRDGRSLLRRRAAGRDPLELGRRLAYELLDECGGRSLDEWWSDDGPDALAPGARRP